MALKYLRDNLKSLTWVLWGVVAVFIMLIFFEWGGVNDRRAAGREVAATVGDEEITMQEFRQAYQNLENRYRQTFGEQFNRDMAKQFNLPVQALDQLIDRRILLMEAEKVGLRATDSEVRDAILSYPVFQDESGNFIGGERYEELLRANRTSTDQFEDEIREGVLIDKLNTVLAQTAYVSDAEVEEGYREQAEQAKIRFVQLPASQMTGESAATAEDLEAYFADHQIDYELPEQRVAEYLMVDTVKLRREIEIPEEEIAAYYEANPDEYSREEQVRARHILLRITPARPEAQAEQELTDVRRRVEAGEDFAALARELSEDESNSERGGNLGYFGRGKMVKAFEDAAFGASAGDLIGPVKTDFGFHLIEVQDHRAGGLQPLDQVRGAVRARLVSERVEEIGETKVRDIAQRLATAEPSEEDQLQVLADEEGLELQTTEPFGVGDTVTGVGRAPDFAPAAFELEVGGVSEPLKLPRGWAILRLAEVKPPRLPELAEVENQVRKAVEQQNQKKAAVRRLEELSTAVAAGGSFEELSAELGVEIQESNEFGRYGTITGLGSNARVVDQALSLEAGQWGKPVESSLGAVLFEVLDRKTFDPELFEQEKEATRANQESERLNRLLASLIELRRRDLTPKYDAGVLATFGIEQPPA
ncbi:MAG: hypothetical protein GY719_29095 [bacterium]|nr:hypothetical protein [bacterium]